MINLLPAELKEQIRYAKLNRMVLRYVRVTVAVVIVLGGIFAGAYYLIVKQAGAIASDVDAKQAQISKQRTALLPKAQDASERLNAIKYVHDTQTRFSLLIADLAKVLPAGVKLETVGLTGTDKAPVGLTVSSQTYDQVLALRNSLATSPRISAADIVTISCTDKGCDGSLVLSFAPGQAK